MTTMTTTTTTNLDNNDDDKDDVVIMKTNIDNVRMIKMTTNNTVMFDMTKKE